MQIGLKLEEIGGYARITYCFSIFLAAANASSMPHLLKNFDLDGFSSLQNHSIVSRN